jgi:acyl carrier protein
MSLDLEVIPSLGLRSYPHFRSSNANLETLSKQNGEYDTYTHLNDQTLPPYTPPMTLIQNAVVKVLSESIPGVAASGINTNLFLWGLSSIDVLKIRNTLQNCLGIQFPITTIFNYPVIKDLAAEASSSSFESIHFLAHVLE